MAIGDDFSVAANGDIRHVSGTTTYTVLELHRWLQDLADDAVASGDDLVDITSQTPSERSTDNIITLINSYNIDDTAAEYLYDGSITQAGGDTQYSGLVVVGSLASTTTLKIVQDNTFYDSQASPFWGTGLNEDSAANILLRIMVKTRDNGVDVDGKRIRVQSRTYGDTYAEFSLTLGLGNSTAAIFTSTDLNNETAQATVAAWTINNTEGYQGIDVDNDTVDEYYYSKWDRVTSPGGINDVYEYAKNITRAGTSDTIHSMNGELFRGITAQWDYDAESGGPFSEDEEVCWGTSFAYDNEAAGPFTVGEQVTFGTSGATGWLLYLDDQGAIGTMVVAKEPGSGTIADDEQVTGATSGATADVNGVITGQTLVGGKAALLALYDAGTTGTMWVQLLSGAIPTDGALITGGTSGATCDVDGSPTARTVSSCFLGQSTGTSLIGEFGIGVEPTDLSTADKLFDLTNTQKSPPNYQTFYLGGLVVGEDQILVGPKDTGDDFDFNQLLLNATLSGATETAVVVTTAIPSDTPSTGYIRVERDDGTYYNQQYTSWTGSTFTIPSTDYSTNNATAGNDVMIAYIDKLATATTESFTGIYSSDRSLWVRVRDGKATPIKTFETAATFGSGGGSVTAIRTSDL